MIYSFGKELADIGQPITNEIRLVFHALLLSALSP